jgi:hypothetical protein
MLGTIEGSLRQGRSIEAPSPIAMPQHGLAVVLVKTGVVGEETAWQRLQPKKVVDQG